MKTLPVQVHQIQHSRSQSPNTNQPASASEPDLETMNMELDNDLQKKLLHLSTTSGPVHQFSDNLYNKLITQAAGEGETENGVCLNEDNYDSRVLSKQIPGFRQFPFVRFILW